MSSLLSTVLGSVTYIFPSWQTKPLTNEEKLRNRFGDNPSINDVYHEYFSAYSKNLFPLDEATLNQIEQIARRKEIGLQIGDEWHRIILGEEGLALNTTHRPIPNVWLLQKALLAQSVFDRELTKLKKLDCYRVLRETKVVPEIQMLKNAVIPWTHFWKWSERVAAEKQELIGELSKKAQHYGKSLKVQVQDSIQQREGLLREMDARIEAVQAERFSPVEAVFLDPDSEQIRRLHQDSQIQDSSEVYHSPFLHPTLADHYVVPLGDPILDKDAEFILVKRPKDIPDEVWQKFISTENTFSLGQYVLAREFPFNETHQYAYKTDKKTYSIEVCREKVSEVLSLHENRDFWVKTRRKVTAPGKFERTNAPEKMGAVSFCKNIYRKMFSSDWSEHRAATAGPDCHEAMTVSRNAIVKILTGRIRQIPQSVAQNLGEYFNALQVSDVALIKGSYMEDPSFVQEMKLQGMIYQQQMQLYKDEMILPYLESGVKGNFDWAKHGPRFDQLTQNVFEVYGDWSRNLNQFLTELNLPINSKIKDAFGPALVSDLQLFLIDLQAFLREAPHPLIRPVIAARAALAPQDMKGRDQVWTNWKNGKTPEQIDQILSETCALVDNGLKGLGSRLLNVSIPFSSPHMQGEIFDAMNESNPALVPLYGKAIPPIWQNKARLGLARKELMEGTELSPLWLKEADMFSNGDARLLENEFLRSQQAKRYIGASTV